MPTGITRRKFVRGTAAIGGMAAAGAAMAAVAGSNDRVRLGMIGVGNRGDQLIDAFLPHADAQIAAVCDVYEPYLQAAREKVGSQSRTYRDYRKLLEQPDIDAVVIATPDHWHALQCIDACRAGKDVYVEKPLSLKIAEGRHMVEAAEEAARITQVGLQRRSSKVVQEAVHCIHKGKIGQVTVVRCFNLSNEFPIGIGNPPDGEPPAELDWDMWLGPAPKAPYNPNRCLYKFRWFWDYSGGQVTNQGTHFLDIIQWALRQTAPKAVYAVGDRLAAQDNGQVPNTMEVIWEYDGPTFVTFSQHNVNNSVQSARDWHIEFRGTKGTLGIDSGGYEILPENIRTRSVPALSPIDREGNLVQGRARRKAREELKIEGRTKTSDHTRNFLDCVKNRQPTSCPLEVGHRSTTATLLANVALHSGRRIEWDAAKERVISDAAANELLAYKYRPLPSPRSE